VASANGGTQAELKAIKEIKMKIPNLSQIHKLELKPFDDLNAGLQKEIKMKIPNSSNPQTGTETVRQPQFEFIDVGI